MKHLILCLLFTIPFNSANKTISEQEVKHDIEAITVYLNSAEITRKAIASIPSGKSDLVFKGISNRIMEKGMKISISQGVKVYAVTFEDDPDYFEKDAAYKKLIATEDSLVTEARLIDINKTTLLKELEYLSANMKIGGNNGVTYAQIDEGAKYFRERTRALQTAINKESGKRKEITKRATKINKELSQLKTKLNQTNSIIRITVVNSTATTAEVDLRYLVSNAVWKPYYSLRAKGEDQPIILEYQAQIYNDTGHDWNSKPITLAIMDPSNDVSKPTMDAWVLSDDGRYYNKNKSEGKLSKAKGRYKDEKNSDNMEVLQVDDLSTQFEIKDLHVIPSDAKPHLIDVTSYTKNADYFTLSIPKIKDGAFLIARIPDWENLGLLDGSVNLYYNENYQGVSQLDTRQISDTLDISLGKENALNVTRRKLSSMSSEKLIGFNVKETLTYEIIVKNNKSEASFIEVRDQIPLSTSKDVNVKTIQLSGAKLDALSGQLTWNFKLAANESKRIILKFSVKYPKSKRGILKHNSKIIVTPRYF